jgi:hypothetical protein
LAAAKEYGRIRATVLLAQIQLLLGRRYGSCDRVGDLLGCMASFAR